MTQTFKEQFQRFKVGDTAYVAFPPALTRLRTGMLVCVVALKTEASEEEESEASYVVSDMDGLTYHILDSDLGIPTSGA
jgi:hypothetical protein